MTAIDTFTFLFSISTINVVTSIIALLMLTFCCRDSASFWTIVLWFTHAAIYWTANLLARSVLQYTGPSIAFTTWGGFLFFHANVALIGEVIVRKRLLRRPQHEEQILNDITSLKEQMEHGD